MAEVMGAVLETPSREREAHGPDEISRDIELMGVLMEHDWLGIRLLFELRDPGAVATASELARELEMDVDLCAALLAQLLQYDALAVSGERFYCSDHGFFVLRRVEEIATEQKATAGAGTTR